MKEELTLVNVALNPAYPPKKLSPSGAMLRPVVAGRALPPRAVRYISKAELTLPVVLDIVKGMDHGALAVRPRFGKPVDLTKEQIYSFAGLELPGQPVSPQITDAVTSPPPVVEEVPALVEVVEVAPVEPAPVEVAPSEEAPAPEAAPVATLDDLLEPAPAPVLEISLYTAEKLMELKSDRLSEILVAEFEYPADQLYKLKTKQAKIDEILARQEA